MRKKFRYLLVISVVMALILGAGIGGYVYGLNIYEKTLDAMGFITMTDECSVTEIEIDDAETLKVKLEPNGNTQADLVYTVHCYLDGVDTSQQTTSWSASEISSVTKKTVTFTSLNLASALTVKVEITH